MTVCLIEKKCPKCGKIYPATAEYFFRHSKKKDGLNSWCKKCNSNACRKYMRTEKGKTIRRKYHQSEKGKTCQKKYAATVNGQQKRRDNFLRSRYNFTLARYNQLFEQQNGRCAICRKPETASNRFGVRVLAVDHDHKTGRVRGLLCQKCNHALGLLNDSEFLVSNMYFYLMRN